MNEKLSIKEKIGYALGDGAANIAWRGVATFLLIFYTDVFGLTATAAGLLMLIARSSDGIIDILMGIVCDRTNSKYGKFRPWVLWTAIPLAVTLSLLFTSPNLGPTGKIVYAYVTYLTFFLVYTANNIPYGALMAVMTGNDKERTSLGSYRMVGAFTGGMVVQGALLFLVSYFGNINPTIHVQQLGAEKFEVSVSAPKDVAKVNIESKNGIALFAWNDPTLPDSLNVPAVRKSFSMKANVPYLFIATGTNGLDKDHITIIDQQSGYSKAIYLLSVFLALFLIVTFYTTRERVSPPKEQKTNLGKDLVDLLKNRPWIILLLIGLLFNIYNSVKQGVLLYYFTHYMHHQLLAASYMVALMLVSIAGAMITSPIGKKIGKKNLFITALLFSGATNALLAFCGPSDTVGIFTLGMASEFAAAIFPTLFFAMLGDAADYSEYKNKRRATGLVYSAGSFATKLGHGVAAIIITGILTLFNYNGQDASTIQHAAPGIVMLMSWIPALIAALAAIVMVFYPLNQKKLSEITVELNQRREKEITDPSTTN
ncbi:MAG: MFS transporter [Breznakibacter sp.]